MACRRRRVAKPIIDIVLEVAESAESADEPAYVPTVQEYADAKSAVVASIMERA
jgi:GrpB-like predicted nucleotidyltransferase (UPF0157 family)